MTNQSQTVAAAPTVETVNQIGHLQRACACGAAAGVSGKCGTCAADDQLGVQAKLTLNQPGDRFEQEADRVADRVTAQDAPTRTSPLPVTPLIAPTPAPLPQAHRDRDEDEEPAESSERVRRARAPRQFAERLAAETHGGQALDPGLRTALEPRFGHDLGHVRLHTSSKAGALSREIGARAFTHRNHIFFGTGQYQTSSQAGRHLLAHEVTHTLQQGAGGSAPGTVNLQAQGQGGTAAGFFDNIGRAFAALVGAEPDYDDETLKAYLKNIAEIGGIENDYDSDNKAMFVARRITAKKDASGRIEDKTELLGQPITLETRKILIQEMQRGATLGGEEEAILGLMTSLEAPEILQLFEGNNALDASKLRGDIDGDNQVTLDRLLTALGLSAEGLTPRANFENCEESERSAIQKAIGLAKRDLTEAIRRIEEDAASDVVRNSFFLAFRVEEPTAQHLSDMVRRLNAIRDGVGNVHYICDHGENAKSSCNKGSGGHAAFDVTGAGVSICFMPKPDDNHENFAKESNPGLQSRLLIHEAAHFFLGVEDKGYFSSTCEETERAESCLEGTVEECGTSGRSLQTTASTTPIPTSAWSISSGQLAKPKTEKDERKRQGRRGGRGTRRAARRSSRSGRRPSKAATSACARAIPADMFDAEGSSFSARRTLPQRTAEDRVFLGHRRAGRQRLHLPLEHSRVRTGASPGPRRVSRRPPRPSCRKRPRRRCAPFHEKGETRATVRLLTTPYEGAPDRSKVETKLTVTLTDKEAKFL